MVRLGHAVKNILTHSRIDLYTIKTDVCVDSAEMFELRSVYCHMSTAYYVVIM